MTKLYKNYCKLLSNDVLTESNIIALKSRISHNKCSLLDQEVESLKNLLDDCSYNITADHAQKGIDYLRSKCFKNNGQPRKTKQVQYMNSDFFEAIRDYDHFTFVGFEEIDYNMYSNNHTYMPIWRIHTKGGLTFDYCMTVGLEFCEV